MRLSFVQTAAVVASLVVSPPAFGQASGDGILVTGDRDSERERTLEATRSVAQAVDGQIARFNNRVCPRVIGFDDEYEIRAAEAIAATAKSIGADVGGKNCAPNFYLVVVDDGPAFVREIARTYPGIFDGMDAKEVAALSTSPGVARAWAVTAATNSDGAVAGTPVQSGAIGSVNWGYQGKGLTISNNKVMKHHDGSNIDPTLRQEIGAAWVVLETEATLDKTLDQVTDYAAMRGLAMVRAEQLAGRVESILSLFEPSETEPPPGLSEFDRGYLTALYRIPARRWARSQVKNIAEFIAEGQADKKANSRQN